MPGKLYGFFQNAYDFVNEKNEIVSRYKSLLEEYRRLYGDGPVALARAPGRINLIGEHIDYNGCPVIPMAVNRDLIAVFGPGNGIVLQNSDSRFPLRSFLPEENIPPFKTGDWGNYGKAAVQGIVDHCLKEGVALSRLKGINVLIRGNLPSSVGLSSSSALVVLIAIMFMRVNAISLEKCEVASMLAEAEKYVGTRGGGMDQAASLCGRSGHALFINFHPLSIEAVKTPADFCFVIANSLVGASKTENALAQFNRRVSACRAGTSILNQCLEREYPHYKTISLLGDIPASLFEKNDFVQWYETLFHEQPYTQAELAGILEPGSWEGQGAGKVKLYQRMKHVFTEWQRVLQFKEKLLQNDAAGMGALMDESHRSCRDDYEISCPEIELLVDTAKQAGASGSRLTGAGFGGCVISLVEKVRVRSFVEEVGAKYYKDFLKMDYAHRRDLVFPCMAVDGACVVE